MKLGKIPENVLTRSIFKRLNVKRNELHSKQEVGEYCAFLRSDKGITVVSEELNSDGLVNKGSMLVLRLINNLAIKGAESEALLFTILLPQDGDEQGLREIVDELNAAAREVGIPIVNVNTRVSDAVTKPVVSGTIIGTADEVFVNHASPGDDVVVTKWVGLEGTHLIAELKATELKSKFPSHLCYDALNFDKYMSIVPEAATAIKSGVTAMYSMSEGGVFAALWELSVACGVGLDIVLRDIPLKQETVEICNVFDLNPYGLLSGGSLLMTAADGNRLVMELNKAGIEATIIGKCTASNDKILINDEIRRFIEPAKQDEIYRLA